MIGSHIIINTETRTFKHMDALRTIIHEEQIKLSSENIGVIELGKQTYPEQLNTVAKKAVLDCRMQENAQTIDI